MANVRVNEWVVEPIGHVDACHDESDPRPGNWCEWGACHDESTFDRKGSRGAS